MDILYLLLFLWDSKARYVSHSTATSSLWEKNSVTRGFEVNKIHHSLTAFSEGTQRNLYCNKSQKRFPKGTESTLNTLNSFWLTKLDKMRNCQKCFLNKVLSISAFISLLLKKNDRNIRLKYIWFL